MSAPAPEKPYPISAEPYDKAADKDGLWKVFQEFDKDGSGQVDHDEMKQMVESLGMAIKKEELEAMIKAADDDNSGEIDFAEFVGIIEKAKKAQGGTGFADLIDRKKDGTQMSWRTDRIGDKVEIDPKTNSASRQGEGYAVALLDPWLPGDAKMNRGSALFEVDVPSGAEVWIGFVGRNFNPEGDHWNQEFTNIHNQKKNLVTCCSSKDGSIFRNGVNLTATNAVKGAAYGAAGSRRVQLDLNVDDKTMVLRILNETKDMDEVATTEVDELKAEVGVGVCFGPTPAGGEKTVVRLVGSSCEKKKKKNRRASKDMWDDDNNMSLGSTVGADGVGMGETFSGS